MILAPAILAAAVTLTPQQQQVYDVFVELGDKLGTGRFDSDYRDGQVICEMTRSTGDAELDAVFCNAARSCGAGKPDVEVRTCLNDETRKQLFALAVRRSGVEMPATAEAGDAADR